jgi:transposase
MDDEINARFRWGAHYLETNDSGLVCCKYGISRLALRQWAGRYQSEGMAGLEAESKRPKKAPEKKITENQLRRTQNKSGKKIHSYLN